MSVSTTIPQVPTSQLLSAIALESAALAHEFGLSSGKAVSNKGAKKVTAVARKTISVKAFFGPLDFPDSYPSNWA